MNGLRRSFGPALVVGLLAACLAAGCRTVRHEVKVDAINNPAKPAGAAYRLIVRDPPGEPQPALRAKAIADMKTALAARGLYEVPVNGTPEIELELEYGVGPGHLKIEYKARDMLGIDYWGKIPPNGGAEHVLVYDKYIRLSAREAIPGGARAAGPRGEELWSVHVIVEDRRNELTPYLPVLATASIDYIGENSGAETVVQIDGNKAGAQLRPVIRNIQN